MKKSGSLNRQFQLERFPQEAGAGHPFYSYTTRPIKFNKKAYISKKSKKKPRSDLKMQNVCKLFEMRT